ncbi:uncharacterized protein At1g24485-like [Rutidosis leptorrhynchoides]|uniref:uncharacterized protein At1g24485-like n=1 Tax=Rutidosis leptorrhynchoides TaxID=125765 RepID=UPI003A98D6F7
MIISNPDGRYDTSVNYNHVNSERFGLLDTKRETLITGSKYLSRIQSRSNLVNQLERESKKVQGSLSEKDTRHALIVIASIDCGATTTTTDVNTITWTPDDTIISNGISRTVKPSYSLTSVLDTLRVFTSRKKNCYSIGVTQGTKILARATFNYGNYDGLLNPPTFDLIFDGNLWTTVKTSLSGSTTYEVIFVAKGDNVSVCLAQTMPDQFPFISSLAIRSLDSDVYSEVDDNRAIFLIDRLSYGSSKSLRYPDDIYDRIWVSYPAQSGTEQVTNDAIYIDATAPNNPPEGVFQNAITVPTTFQSIIIAHIPVLSPPTYLNLYFSEVTSLDFGQKRSFNIYENSSPVQLAITPPYMQVEERYIYNYVVTSDTNLSLSATSDSDLPPIINAIELFTISDILTDGTDSNDVKALALLQSTFDVLQEWRGDPCLPAPYSWDWLNCSNDVIPRVTALYLNSFNLVGSIPDISSMDALVIIDLHNNSLSGTIPSFLGTMSNLQQLNLADNKFSGSIPSSLSNNGKLKLTVTGNPSLCTSGKSCSSSLGSTNSSPGSTNSSSGSGTSTSKKKSSMLPLILGIVIPVFILLWIAFAAFIIFRRKKIPAEVNMQVISTGDRANINPDAPPVGSTA